MSKVNVELGVGIAAQWRHFFFDKIAKLNSLNTKVAHFNFGGFISSGQIRGFRTQRKDFFLGNSSKCFCFFILVFVSVFLLLLCSVGRSKLFLDAVSAGFRGISSLKNNFNLLIIKYPFDNCASKKRNTKIRTEQCQIVQLL